MKKNISKAITSVLVGALVVVTLIFCSCIAHNYTINGYVDYLTDESIVVVDTTGNVWEYLFDDTVKEDTFTTHEAVVIHFNDNCSDSERVDDIITGIDKVNK